MDCQGWGKDSRLSSNLEMSQATLKKLSQPTRSGRARKPLRSANLLLALPSGRHKEVVSGWRGLGHLGLHAERQADFSIASTTTRPWTSEERERVPQWFRARKHLPHKEVVAQFEQDFGHRRSFGAIQTASYYRSKTKGHGNPHKRRRTLPSDNPSLQLTTTEPAPVIEPSNNLPLSLTTDSVPRVNISFLDALKSFPRSEVPGPKRNQPKVLSAESLQAANAEAPSNAASCNERSSSSASASEIRGPGQPVTGVLLPTVAEAVGGRVSSGNDYD
jgi:hypothetical protein